MPRPDHFVDLEFAEGCPLLELVAHSVVLFLEPFPHEPNRRFHPWHGRPQGFGQPREFFIEGGCDVDEILFLDVEVVGHLSRVIHRIPEEGGSDELLVHLGPCSEG